MDTKNLLKPQFLQCCRKLFLKQFSALVSKKGHFETIAWQQASKTKTSNTNCCTHKSPETTMKIGYNDIGPEPAPQIGPEPVKKAKLGPEPNFTAYMQKYIYADESVRGTHDPPIRPI